MCEIPMFLSPSNREISHLYVTARLRHSGSSPQPSAMITRLMLYFISVRFILVHIRRGIAEFHMNNMHCNDGQY